jgi:hypothetical protein
MTTSLDCCYLHGPYKEDGAFLQTLIDTIREVLPIFYKEATTLPVRDREWSRNRHPVIDCPRPIHYVICTDNPTLNVTTLSRELILARQIAGVSRESFLERQFQLASQASFAPEAVMTLIS